MQCQLQLVLCSLLHFYFPEKLKYQSAFWSCSSSPYEVCVFQSREFFFLVLLANSLIICLSFNKTLTTSELWWWKWVKTIIPLNSMEISFSIFPTMHAIFWSSFLVTNCLSGYCSKQEINKCFSCLNISFEITISIELH